MKMCDFNPKFEFVEAKFTFSSMFLKKAKAIFVKKVGGRNQFMH